jgi:hypothetical protein
MKRYLPMLLCFTLCSACQILNRHGDYKPGNNSTLSATHQKIVSKLSKKPAPKGKSWSGRWIFIVTAGDGHRMEPYTVLSKNTLDSNGKFIKSEKVDYFKMEPNQFLHAGFITLTDEKGQPGGYDLTGYGKVKIPYTGLKVKDNELSWDFTWFPSKGDKRNFMAQEYHREAKYDPQNDVLYGTCTMKIYKKIKVAGKEKIVVAPIGQYVWKASRLSEEDFGAAANTGKRHPGLPQAEYTVYIGTSQPEFKRLLDRAQSNGQKNANGPNVKFLPGAGLIDTNNTVYK